MMRKLSVLILCFAVLLVAIPALAQDANTTSGQPAAFVRFANFAPGMSITFSSANNQMVAIKPLDYKALSEWVATPPGKYALTASSSGANASKSEETEIDFKDGGWFT